MTLLNLDEIRNLFKNTTIHWVVKANIIKRYIDDHSFEKACYDLNLTQKTIEEYWKLSKYLQFFPVLKDIPSRTDALRVIKYNEGNSVKMRDAIAREALRFKTKLARYTIKNSMKGV